jgi:hypothetical protein
VAGSCGHGNEPLGSTKGAKFLDEVSDYYFFKKGSARRIGIKFLYDILHRLILSRNMGRVQYAENTDWNKRILETQTQTRI